MASYLRAAEALAVDLVAGLGLTAS